MAQQLIEGVSLKVLRTHPDERGYFRELIRVNDGFFGEGFGQWNETKMVQGVIKAWHVHRRQVDWWYVLAGTVRAVLYDAREGSGTVGRINVFLLGDDRPACVLRIPAGVTHGCKVLSGPAIMHYVVSRMYDPEDNDEGRIPHDDPAIGYDWLERSQIT